MKTRQELNAIREAQKRTSWIENVKRVKDYSQEEAESAWSKIFAPQQSQAQYKCQTCDASINEGEFKTFGVCDNCYDASYKKQTAMTQSDAPNEQKTEEQLENDLADFLKEKYVWVRSQDGGETLILHEYYKGNKRICRGTVIPKTKSHE